MNLSIVDHNRRSRAPRFHLSEWLTDGLCVLLTAFERRRAPKGREKLSIANLRELAQHHEEQAARCWAELAGL